MPLFPTLFAREADLREEKSNIYVDYFSKICRMEELGVFVMFA
jgi:hypothetical protein